MSQGWIKLHRKMQDNELWREHRTFSKAEAWIDILMEAQHKNEAVPVTIKMHTLMCYRGDSLKSMRTWARRWHWGASKVSRFLRLLADRKMITHKTEGGTTRISVCNYTTYNEQCNDNGTASRHDRDTTETRSNTDKKVKKEKNAKNFVVPTAQEVADYGRSIDYKIDGETFIAHYQANGWIRGKTKIKDWKACVVTWKKRDSSKKPDPNRSNTGCIRREA